MHSTAYDTLFYGTQRAGSLRSAKIVTALLTECMPVRSVVDVGCGVGTWLAAFMEAGAEEIAGYDGPYVERQELVIPPTCFHPANLEHLLSLDRRYDLALCLEVGEHLPEAAAPVLVESLTGASDLVLFSAAIPGQGGTSHLNERWPGYWAEMFRARGYVARDWIRPILWQNELVEWWYAQNIILYATTEALARFPRLDLQATPEVAGPLPLVHPRAFHAAQHRNDIPGVRSALRTLLTSVHWSAKRRFRIRPLR